MVMHLKYECTKFSNLLTIFVLLLDFVVTEVSKDFY